MSLLLLSDVAGAPPPPTNNVTDRVTLWAAAPSGFRVFVGFAQVQHQLQPVRITLFATANQGLQLTDIAPTSGNVPAPGTFILVDQENTVNFYASDDTIRFR